MVLKGEAMYKTIYKTTLFVLMFSTNLLAGNPVYSPTFDTIMAQTLPQTPYRFDDQNITINVPRFADNPTQVPIFVDASKIKDARRVIVFADLNPIPEIVDMRLTGAKAVISFNIRVAQETPIRALVEDGEGKWHVGSANIKSSGGGCSVSNTPEQSKSFALLLGHYKSQVTHRDGAYRIKFSIFHPMDSGLFFGNAAFYIERMALYDGKKLLADLTTTSTISQNPRILLETKEGEGDYTVVLSDTDANEYRIPAKFGEK